jgi:predicted DNA-binding protein
MARPKKGQELGVGATIGVRVSAELRQQLEAIAAAHGRTITQEARVAFERHVATVNVKAKVSRKRHT